MGVVKRESKQEWQGGAVRWVADTGKLLTDEVIALIRGAGEAFGLMQYAGFDMALRVASKCIRGFAHVAGIWERVSGLACLVCLWGKQSRP